MVEYGQIEYARGGFDPPDIVWGGTATGQRPGFWTFNSLPNPAVKNKTALVLAGQTVGGSSAINGMFFDRPSRFDHDAWAQLLCTEYASSEHKWDWDGIFKYFKKVRGYGFV